MTNLTNLCNVFIERNRYSAEDTSSFWNDVKVQLATFPATSDNRSHSLCFAVDIILNTKAQTDEETRANIISHLQEVLSIKHQEELDARICNIFRRFFDLCPSSSFEPITNLIQNVQHRVEKMHIECNNTEKLKDLIYIVTSLSPCLTKWDNVWENLALAILEKQTLATNLNLAAQEKSVFSFSFPNFLTIYLQQNNGDIASFTKMNDLLVSCAKLIKHASYQSWARPVPEFVKSAIQMETIFAGE